MIFLCDKFTVRYIWHIDPDVGAVSGPGTFSIVVASTIAYPEFLHT